MLLASASAELTARDFSVSLSSSDISLPDAIAPYTIELYLVFCDDVRFANPAALFKSVIAVSPSKEYVLADNENEFSEPLSFELMKNLCCFSSNVAFSPALLQKFTKSFIVVLSFTSKALVLFPTFNFKTVPSSIPSSLNFVDVVAVLAVFPSVSL